MSTDQWRFIVLRINIIDTGVLSCYVLISLILTLRKKSSFYEQFVTYLIYRSMFKKPSIPKSMGYILFGFSILCAVDFCMENMALNVWSVSMNEIVRSLSPMFTALLQFSQTPGKRWVSLVALTFGVFLSVFESSDGFILTGFLMSFCTVITSSLMAILSTQLRDMDTIDIIGITSVPIMYFVFIPMLFLEYGAFSRTLYIYPTMSLAYLLVDTVSVFINHYSLMKVIMLFGPVGAAIIDCLLVVLAIIYSELYVTQFAFNGWRWFGIATTITVFAYDSFSFS